MKFDLIGIGEAMVELYADQKLGTANHLQKSYGGDVLNSLVHASRIGLKTGFISRVGNDPFGQALLETWQSEGLDISQAPLVDGENGVYFISLSADAEREFTYRRAGSAASQLQISDLDPTYITSSKILLLSGITQAISSSATDTTLEAAKIARQHQVLVAFDPNYRPKLWESRGGLEAARAACQALLPLVDILLPSSPNDLAVLQTEDQTDLLELAKIVAVKCGQAGALVKHNAQIRTVPAQTVPVLDTTGAGDAWNAAFLSQWLISGNVLDAAQAANAYAAIKIQSRGAIPPR